MDTEEKQMLNEIIERLNQLEEENKSKYVVNPITIDNPDKSVSPDKSAQPDKKGKKEKVTLKIIFQIIFRAMVVGLIAFALGNIYMRYFDKNEEEKSKDENTNLITKPDTIKVKYKSLLFDSTKMKLEEKIDSLNTLFIEEVSGEGSDKKAGYGPKAIALKSQIKALQQELKK